MKNKEVKQKDVSGGQGQLRRLKVYPKFSERVWGRPAKFPEIRLSGKWVQELGFEIGNEVSVKREKGRITVMVLEEE